ncbi:MAG: Holliday junction branch migration protein RuvA [Dehalococcoidia bacterium]|nr:Holliday junction branch migration protein RuvA [Dehalococcoidia bacterium]
MISGIEGVLRYKSHDAVVVDVNGISFRIRVPTSTLSDLGPTGKRVHLHTHLMVKEDSLALFGFASDEEIRAFELLIGVTGIGPKAALAVLSALNPARLALAITSGDEALLSSIPGVGRKTAGRIVLELRSKFEQGDSIIIHPHDDVRAALISLGYTAAEASNAMAAIPVDSSLPLEDRVKLALKHFASS